jgi:hypothetical protein
MGWVCEAREHGGGGISEGKEGEGKEGRDTRRDTRGSKRERKGGKTAYSQQ